MSTDLDDEKIKDSNTTEPPSNGSAAPEEEVQLAVPENPCHCGQDEADLADAQIKDSGFALVTKYVSPFSTQVKLECRAAFPSDVEKCSNTLAYDIADKNQIKAISTYFVLKLATLGLFGAYIAVLVLALSSYILNEGMSGFPFWTELGFPSTGLFYYTYITPKPESFDVILCGNYL